MHNMLHAQTWPKRSDTKVPSVSKQTKKDHRSECSTCLSVDWFTCQQPPTRDDD